jgi:hypothetical protein
VVWARSGALNAASRTGVWSGLYIDIGRGSKGFDAAREILVP